MLKLKQLISLTAIAGLVLISGCGSQSNTQSSSTNQQTQEKTQEQPKVLTVATLPVGSLINSLGAGIATELSNTTGIEVKAIATTGPQEYMPLLATNEMDLGVVSNWDSGMAWSGKSSFAQVSNNKGFSISLITSGIKSYVVPVLAANSPIKNGSDLKGKNFAGIITASPGITAQNDAFLANYGLTRSDVKMITVPTLTAGVQAVIPGQADAACAAIGTVDVRTLDAAKGARFLSLDPSPEAAKRTNEYFQGKIVKLSPSEAYVGIKGDTNVLQYDMYLIGRNNLSETTVYNLVKSLWDNNNDLIAINSALKTWTTNNFVVDNFTIPYHPGAIKFYKEKGIWTPAMDQLQQSLLASKK